MAATNINRVVLTGNLTRDPELRNTPSGTPVSASRPDGRSTAKRGARDAFIARTTSARRPSMTRSSPVPKSASTTT